MIMERLQQEIEKRTFGVCDYLGEKLGIRSSVVRKWFIYSSFVTFGSPVLIYLVLAFFIENKDYFKSKRSSIWEL
jgi:phage shock protein PspC (stress-responsive transcriptional regulator)